MVWGCEMRSSESAKNRVVAAAAAYELGSPSVGGRSKLSELELLGPQLDLHPKVFTALKNEC